MGTTQHGDRQWTVGIGMLTADHGSAQGLSWRDNPAPSSSPRWGCRAADWLAYSPRSKTYGQTAASGLFFFSPPAAWPAWHMNFRLVDFRGLVFDFGFGLGLGVWFGFTSAWGWGWGFGGACTVGSGAGFDGACTLGGGVGFGCVCTLGGGVGFGGA